MSRCSVDRTEIKLKLTVALVVRKRASWLILDTSGELFIISLTLEIGSEMFFLFVDVWSSFSGVFPDIFSDRRNFKLFWTVTRFFLVL